MIYLDTNILLRIVTGEPARQAAAAARLVDERRDEVYLPFAILAEAVFVLRGRYALSPEEVADVLVPVVSALRTGPGERERMVQALSIFADRKVDIVDAWLAAETRALGHRVASFDRDLVRCGADVVVPA